MFLGQIKSVPLRLVSLHFHLDLLREKGIPILCFNSSATGIVNLDDVYRLQLYVKKQECMQFVRIDMSFFQRILRRVTGRM